MGRNLGRFCRDAIGNCEALSCAGGVERARVALGPTELPEFQLFLSAEDLRVLLRSAIAAEVRHAPALDEAGAELLCRSRRKLGHFVVAPTEAFLGCTTISAPFLNRTQVIGLEAYLRVRFRLCVGLGFR